MERPSSHEALHRRFGAARTTLRWIQWTVGGTAVVALVALLILARVHFFAFGQIWLWIFKGAAALGAGIGVKLGARRARGAVRQLPDVEAVQILRPLAEGEDEDDRRLAKELLKGLHPEGTEVVASEAPAGRGSEVAAEGEDARGQQQSS
jgi:hypothetical protein